jgi:hypothetical protein
MFFYILKIKGSLATLEFPLRAFVTEPLKCRPVNPEYRTRTRFLWFRNPWRSGTRTQNRKQEYSFLRAAFTVTD